jgi:hypothetical protein
MGKKEESGGALIVAPPPAGDAGARAVTLLQTLSKITADDLDALDVVIDQEETRLATMKQFRKVAAALVTPQTAKAKTKPGPKPKAEGSPPGPSPMPKNEEERAKKIDGLRKQVVIYISKQGKAVRSHDIITNCRVAPKWINELLDHAWFSQSSQGIHITPEARQEVLES